jgi:hypothetical protein
MNNIMHPDDAAELQGDGYTPEHQRVHAQARASLSAQHNPDDVRIESALAAGRFVAVAYTPAYCRSTDAYIGEVRYMVCDGATRAAVNAQLEVRIASGLDVDDDARVEILPRETPVVSPVVADEIPF